MRGTRYGLLLSAFLLLGCNQREAASSAGPKSPGRYAGIGTFDAGRLWQEMRGASPTQDAAAAKLADDEHVIVVLDSHTGEVRQCGDHSGYCVSMNPWTASGPGSAVPVKLNKHASDIDAENNAASPDENAATSTK